MGGKKTEQHLVRKILWEDYLWKYPLDPSSPLSGTTEASLNCGRVSFAKVVSAASPQEYNEHAGKRIGHGIWLPEN